jgi:hypothetical protein
MCRAAHWPPSVIIESCSVMSIVGPSEPTVRVGVPGHRRLDVGIELLDEVRDDALDQHLLAREMMEQGALGHAGGLADPLHGHRGEAMLQVELGGAVQQRSPDELGLLPASVARFGRYSPGSRDVEGTALARQAVAIVGAATGRLPGAVSDRDRALAVLWPATVHPVPR